MADATIRIKLGQIEFDYQGDASFLKKDLLDTVKKLLELQERHPAAAQLSHSKSRSDGEEGGQRAKGSLTCPPIPSRTCLAQKLGRS